MKKYFMLAVLAALIAGCSSDSTDKDTGKPKQNVTKKNDAEELSIKDIEEITAKVNYNFSKNNLPLDSTTYIDSLKKEISAHLKGKKNKSTL
jgi:PBP1b-binding outer membrane lipoprotein LpoB